MIKRKSKDRIKKEKLTVYLILRLLVVLCMVAQSLHGNWNNVFLCIFTLILFTLPSFISEKYNIDFPKTLEVIVYLFIFSSEILGEIQNFYGLFSHWDTMLHTLNGFLCAAIGFSLVDILNNNKDFHISMNPAFLALVAFSFSMTVGVMWEFAEFGIDKYLDKDMQKDRIVKEIKSIKINEIEDNTPVIIKNIKKTEITTYDNTKYTINNGYLEIGLIDTMKDLFVNFIGAIIFSVLGYLYIKNRDEYHIVEKFIPKINSKVK